MRARNSLAYYNRATINGKNGDYDKQIEDYNKAIRFNTNFIPAYYARGLARLENGDCDKAIFDFTDVIINDPKFPGVYSSRGLAWFDKKEPEKAISDFIQALIFDPDDEVASEGLKVLHQYDSSKGSRLAIRPARKMLLSGNMQ